MEDDTNIILTDFETDTTSLLKSSDLNNLFNFTYNFDFLKEILTTVIKNQISLKNQLDEKYQAQNNIIESFKKEIIYNKQAEQQSNESENLGKINEKINKLEIMIGHINKELDKSKLLFNNNYFILFYFRYKNLYWRNN